MFRITMLPAEHGDCLWLEYGEDGERPRRVLIDGGTPGSFAAIAARVEALPAGDRPFELLVITHIDSDHIGGALQLLAQRQDLGVTLRDVWFNGYVHLDPEFADILGPVQGEKLTEQIVRQALGWNRAFRNRGVVVGDEGKLPAVILDGGLKLTLVSPTGKELSRLRPEWERTVRRAGLEPGAPAARPRPKEKGDILGEEDIETLANRRFGPDTAVANASSIALIAEYEGTSILLGGDAQVPVLTRTLARLSPEERKRIQWCKLPHHGSRANVSTGLVEALGCHNFLVSTNGKIHNHPDKEAIARVITRGDDRHLYFNYRSDFNQFWDDPTLMRRYHYQVHYPEGDDSGMTIDL